MPIKEGPRGHPISRVSTREFEDDLGRGAERMTYEPII
jgi:hypothetical protein